jgi:hypothetical protein
MDSVPAWPGSVLLGAKEGSRGPRVCLEFSVVFVSPEDLDKITEEGDASSVEGERKSPSQAKAPRRRAPSEGSDGSSANDTESESATGEL